MRGRERHCGQRRSAPERARAAQVLVHETPEQDFLGHAALREHAEREPCCIRPQRELERYEAREQRQTQEQERGQPRGREQRASRRWAETERAGAMTQRRARQQTLRRQHEYEHDSSNDETCFAARAAERRREPIEREVDEHEQNRGVHGALRLQIARVLPTSRVAPRARWAHICSLHAGAISSPNFAVQHAKACAGALFTRWHA